MHMRVMFAAALAAFFMVAAQARDSGEYEHVSPVIRDWFRSLHNPQTGIGCCSEADCKRTEQRIEDGHYLAVAPDGTWLPIDDKQVVHDQSNPTGEPVLCTMKFAGNWVVYCFVPGALL